MAADAPLLETSRGERVRSKSEVIIADTLDRLKIPYRYEFPHQLKVTGTAAVEVTDLAICKAVHPKTFANTTTLAAP